MSEKKLKIIRIISHGLSLFLVFIFLLFLFGEGIGGVLSPRDTLLFMFIPILYTIGAVLMLLNKEKIGDALMIVAVLGFNIAVWIMENSYFQDFEFNMFLLPPLLNYVYLFLNNKYVKK